MSARPELPPRAASGGDPFTEGREAHDAGKSETANPYPEEGDDFLEWNDGWNQAAEDGVAT